MRKKIENRNDGTIKPRDIIEGIKYFQRESKNVIKGIGKGLYIFYATPTASRGNDQRYINNGSIECFTMGGYLAGAVPDLFINMGIVSIINNISNQPIDLPFLTLMIPHLVTNTFSGVYEHIRRISCDREIREGNKKLENLAVIKIAPEL